MAGRRAVGASLAAVVLFSSVVVSNFVLVSGEQGRMRLISVATEERVVFDKAMAVESVVVFEALGRMQMALSSSTFTCSNATEAVSSDASSVTAHVTFESLTASSSLSPAVQANLRDNLTSLQPFAGAVKGWTDLMARVWVRSSSPDGSVSLNKNESHLVALPLRLPDIVSECLQGFSLVESVLRDAGNGLCNATLVERLLGLTGASLSPVATAAGFTFTLGYGISAMPCSVSFVLGLEQSHIVGPYSAFKFEVEQRGTVSWPPAGEPF